LLAFRECIPTVALTTGGSVKLESFELARGRLRPSLDFVSGGATLFGNLEISTAFVRHWFGHVRGGM